MPVPTPGRVPHASIRTLVIVLLLLSSPGASGAAAAAEEIPETWSGTWNAPNLWRSVDLTLRRESPTRSTFAIGTAREKSPGATRSFALDDTSLTAEIDHAGTVVQLHGRFREGSVAGRLRVMRGESVLAEGSWSMERRFPSDLAADEIRARARRALRFPGALAAGYAIEQAPAESSVAPAVPAWAAHVGPRGEVAVREDGAPTLHFAGGSVLRTSEPFGWLPADARMQDKLLLAEVVRSGAWLAEASPLRFAAHVIGVGDRRRYLLEITTAAGVVPASVTFDPATWLPERAAAAWDAGDRSFRFADYREQAGSLFPGTITSAYRGRETSWRTTRVVPGGDPIEPPAPRRAQFDPTASPDLAGTRGAGENGHLFVRPTVAGRDVGWFHVDTGAPFVILDTRVADELGLEVLRAMGPRSVRRLPEIRVGQLILRDLPVLVTDLSGFSAPDSARRSGVIGGPIFESSVVVFDYPGNRLSVFAPDAFREPVGAWEPLSLEGPPVIEATVDGRRERFGIDTGKSGTVSFMSGAAARRGLYEGRRLEEASNQTVEGASVELVSSVTSFELGARHFDDPEVRLKLAGTTNDDVGTTAGVIGRGLFHDRRVVFDYPRGRIAFLEAR